MSLDQLRLELLRGTLCGPDIPGIQIDALGGQLAKGLREIAASRTAGPRLQLPREQMPVLP
ncbi:hypothetical protein [Paraburkholderia sp. D1E]|uniref:hypothetical protein n=1 Tax=Paraburkholderia sp. D1E TaxID=3461398 RepID=UPI0040459B6E